MRPRSEESRAKGWRARLADAVRGPARHERDEPPQGLEDRAGVIRRVLAAARPTPPGQADSPQRLPEAEAEALATLAAGLPMDQALGLIAGWTRGASLRAWLPVEPGAGVSAQDPAVTALLSEAWVATTGYAGLLAALVSYLAIRPALDQAAFPTDERLLAGLRRAASTARAVPPGAAAVQKLVTEAVVDPADGGTLHLDGGTLRFPERAAAWVVLHELAVRRSYEFEPGPARAASPRILDCGAHHGLAVWAFKRRFPAARITAFEPDNANREILAANLAANGWSDVEVLPFALAAEDGEATFAVAEGRSMAGTLTDRLGTATAERTVPTRRLSTWLREPIDFLKLDIEGPEAEVLAEAARGGGLEGVEHLFCEYHHGHGLPSDRLHRLLATLDGAGFDVQLGRSFTAELGNAIAPLLDAGKPYALDIHAKRGG